MQAERLPQTPLDPVADDRPAKRTWYRESEARSHTLARARPRETERSEQRVGQADAVVIDNSEIGGTQDSARSGEVQTYAGGAFSSPLQTGRLSRR